MNNIPLACLLAAATGLVFGDLMPPDTHVVSRSVIVTNISAYPSIALIGIVKDLSGGVGDTLYSVKDGVPLVKGYRYGTLDLFAIDAALLDSLKTSDAPAMQHIYSKYSPAEVMDPSGTRAPNSNPLDSEMYFYKLEDVTDTTLNLKLFKSVLKFRGILSDVTTYY
jgi:hypothetical protein